MSKTTVLIVEDEAIVAADLSGKLRRLGYEVCGIASEGEEAVALASGLRPRLVLMDIRLEGSMDGIAAAEAIRSRIDVPVIYLTALSDAATLARAKLTGPFGYILKPFEERELAAQIELALYKHHADRQVREQREWLRVTLCSIGDAVIATDGEGRITFINPVAESLTGWKADEAMGQPLECVFCVVDERTGQTVEEPVACVLREGRAVPLANHAALVTRDGRTVPIEDSAAPIKDAAGQVIGAVLVFQDVTAKRRAEDAIRQSEERLQLAVRATGDAIYDIDLAQGGVTWNETYTRRFGRTPETGDSWQWWIDRIHPDDRERVVASFKASLEGEADMLTVEYRFLRADGEWADVCDRAYVARDPSGKAWRMVGAMMDLTARKQAERKIEAAHAHLLNERNRLEAVMEALPVGVAILDSRGGNVQSNRTYEQIWNGPRPPVHSVEDYAAYKAWRADTGEPVQPEEWASARSVQTGEIVIGQIMQIERFDGSRAFVHNSAAPFFDERGQIVGCAVAIMDITDRVEAEEALKRARDELELRVEERTAELLKLNEALDEFASIASHDMQEPLRKILSFGDQLKRQCGDSLDDTGKDYLERMRKAAKRMQTLLTALLTYSRVSRKAEPFTRVDLSGLIRDVLDDLEVRIHQTGGEVEVGDLPAIEADLHQMRQLFQNLIGNGLKYHGEKKPVVKIHAELSNGSEWRITVEDNGIGFDQKHADRIFAPFQRLHGKSEYEGTGMGLAICNKIVERHGGSIMARSVPGEGSLFIINLPVTRSGPESPMSGKEGA